MIYEKVNFYSSTSLSPFFHPVRKRGWPQTTSKVGAYDEMVVRFVFSDKTRSSIVYYFLNLLIPAHFSVK